MRVEPGWRALAEQAARLVDARIPDLVAADPARSHGFALRVGPLYANFARQRYDREALAVLFALAREAGAGGALRQLVDGAALNRSEARPALHTALRGELGEGALAQAARAQALAALQRMRALASRLRFSGVTDVVNVGIGGSDLGPRLASEALQDYSDRRFRLHFLDNADAGPTHRLMATLDPARTAVVLVSKSFGTQETLLNATLLRPWLGDDARLYAVTAQVGRAEAFGVHAEHVLPIWDWVGGRYSLWSAVGFVLLLAIGEGNHGALLEGAAAMDAHVLAEPLQSNLAAWHALTVVWNRNGLGLDTHAVLPYDERLARLPAYLQQLAMESLGKSVRQDGLAAGVATVPVLWGGAGTSSQHSFFQALHQGSDSLPADFIGVARPAHPHAGSHDALLAHLLAQTEALANGMDAADAQHAHAGNRPSTTILLDELTPCSLGMLLALYEHSVFLQATVWGINPFDQWGVELGKRIAGQLLPAVAARSEAGVDDPVTRALLAELNARR
jgi:glucose-6-phosphate isomerase